MDFQVQKLIPKLDLQKEKDDLDLFVGVRSGLDDPYNLFFRISDIERTARQIYFYAYSIGKKKIVFWGIYDMDENDFLVDDACRYHPNNMKKMLDVWKSHTYEFFSSSVRDRIKPRMALATSFDNPKTEEKLFLEFKDYFMVSLIRGKQISSNSVQKTQNVQELLAFPDRIFDSDYQIIMDEIQNHITSVDDIEEDFFPLFENLFSQIETRKSENLIRDAIDHKSQDSIRKLEKDEFDYKLYRYIMINYFISLFTGIEEYRVAKYMVFSNDQKNMKPSNTGITKDRFEPYIKGTFFYEWLIELSKVFRSDDSRAFIVNYAKTFVNFMEKRVNMTTIGVIGGPRRNSSQTLEQIANFFTEFVSISKYSKISVVNELKECPSEDVCDMKGDGTCGLYHHGGTQSSKFDLT